MALGPLDRRETRESRRPRRSTLALASVTALVLAALIVGAAIAAIALSRGSLKQSPTALADLKLGPLAGHVEKAVVSTPNGSSVRLVDVHGALVPRKPLEPGVRARLTITVRRPGALAWMLGKSFTKHLTLRTPSVTVAKQWLTLSHSGRLEIAFTGHVAALALGDTARGAAHGRTLTLNPSVRSGSLAIRLAARTWERLGPSTLVTWFPRSRVPLLVAAPSPAATISPTSSLRLTFSRPVARIFGASNPPLSPSVAGTWTRPNSHTLLFTPAGAGFPLAATVALNLPTVVAANDLEPADRLSWTVAPGSELRLQQLLAQLGYLPLRWTANGAPPVQSAQAQVMAAVNPPAGSFSWRYTNTPAALRALWHPGHPGEIVKGAVMSFEAAHGLATDGIAGPIVWHTLLAAALANQQRTSPYAYVLVREGNPESLTVYSGGRVVLRTAANTGIPQRPTKRGTFAVFEHVRSGTMTGTNPDGTHYHDVGIPWISYFNGGDAIHGFLRVSYGTRQSLGCVELPYAQAAKVWPYTPIGTLVTVTT